MRAYLLVVTIILAMMGGYIALLPLTAWSDSNNGISGSGPG